MTTFTWDGDDVKTVGPVGTEIKINNIFRPFTIPLRRRKLQVPGRDGSWDFGPDGRSDYVVGVEMTIIGDTAALAQECAEEVGTFLEGKHELIFSDSSVVHEAQIYEAAALTPEGRKNVIRLTVNFECDGG